MTYEKFEHKAVRALLEGNDLVFERLFDQFLDAEVSRREETKTGFVVEFEVSGSLAVDKMTRKISGVRVTLGNEEILLLELTVSEGLITKLSATYTSKIGYSNLLSKFNDLVFSQFLDVEPVDPKPEFVELNKFSCNLDVTNKDELKEVEFDQNLESSKKSELSQIESAEIEGLLDKAPNIVKELGKISDQLLNENPYLKKLIVQDQILTSRLARKPKELQNKNLKIEKESNSIAESEEKDKQPLILAESNKKNDVITQDDNQNLELIKKVEKFQKSFDNSKLRSDILELKEEKKDVEPKNDDFLVDDQEEEEISNLTDEATDAKETLKESIERLAREQAEKAAQEQAEKITQEQAEKIAQEQAEKAARKQAKKTTKEKAGKIAEGKERSNIRKRFITGINILFYLFFAVSIIAILLLGIQTVSSELPEIMGFSAPRVVSRSGDEDFLVNSLVIIRQGNTNDLEIGQTVVYSHGNRSLIVHRIYDIEVDNYGNNYAFILSDTDTYLNNQAVPSEDILGYVVFTSHILGSFLLFLETWLVPMVVTTLLLGLLASFGDKKK